MCAFKHTLILSLNFVVLFVLSCALINSSLIHRVLTGHHEQPKVCLVGQNDQPKVCLVGH